MRDGRVWLFISCRCLAHDEESKAYGFGIPKTAIIFVPDLLFLIGGDGMACLFRATALIFLVVYG